MSMNNEWKMPEWMIKWVHVIDTNSRAPSVETVEEAMDSIEYISNYPEICIRAKVELMETLHKKGII